MGVVPPELPWVAVLILFPLLGGMACFLWPAMARAVGLVTVAGTAAAVAGLGVQVLDAGRYRHPVGGWGAPLGIELQADGLSVLLLATTALVGLGVSVYSNAYFEPRRVARFWPLWLFLLAALNALFLSADVFNLYVCLELIGLASVALTALAGGRDALLGAMRYLLATLLGSLSYLLGVAVLYHAFGTVDIALLGARVEPGAAVWAALALMAAGLLLKSALFPLHFWLPDAHANAPAPVSALLSALVVKAAFYLLLRLWLEVFGPLGGGVGDVLGVLGAAAVLWGSLQALRQTRIKLLVAYSTVAQVGYLFLAFPLAGAGTAIAWQAAAYLVLSHALAKAAMFLAAGNLLRFGGHDRIADLDRIAQRLPMTVSAFALAGVSIMGLPPSGGFIGKWLLVQAAVEQGQWTLALVMILGGLLAAAYVFRVLGFAFTEASEHYQPVAVPRSMEWAALALALGAIALGLVVAPVLALVDLGAPFAAGEASP